jgi:LPXTG-site transpeptidase (sortase) family protein
LRTGSPTPRSPAPLGVALALVGIFCISAGLGQLFGLPVLLDGSPRGAGAALGRSTPTRISIPALDLRAPVVEVEHASDGSIGTPAQDPANSTGWYRLGPAPGELGTAVIVGHVDTESAPAVFHKVATLRPGSSIEVRRSDRRVATFSVDSVETFPKAAFPAQRIFTVSDRAQLALVTCGGQWVGGDIGYTDNVIVFATLR